MSRATLILFAVALVHCQVMELRFTMISRWAIALGFKPDAIAFRLMEPKANLSSPGFSVEAKSDRLVISLDSKPATEFVFRDDKILRPYFAQIRIPGGLQVTRNHPPVDGVDPTDHDTMHPGLWLGFGIVNGHDFWRNKGRMEHVGFTSAPQISEGRLTFATECHLKSADGEPVCALINRFTLLARPVGWLVIWDATFKADVRELSFGDQEEMGFGARVATSLTEKNGGRIINSAGLKTAQQTWGQAAAWCDYSGTDGERSGGIMLMASPANFRESWWHNRDYGVFVANPFGREAMKQGEKSDVKVPKGKSLQIVFGALMHEGQEINGTAEFEVFKQILNDTGISK